MNTQMAFQYAQVAVETAHLFRDIGEAAKPYYRAGTVPEFSTFGRERLYWLWYLGGAAGAMYKANDHLKGIVDGARNEIMADVIDRVHSQLPALFERNLLRVHSCLIGLLRSDRDYVVGMLATNLRNSDINQAVNDHPAYLDEVLSHGESYLSTPAGIIALLGYSAGLAKGIRELADRAFDDMFPDRLNENVFSYLDSAGFSGLFLQLVEEINATYSFGCYVSTAFLSRKLLESLVIGILQKKYAGTADVGLYLNADGKYKEFHTLFDSFWNRFDSVFRSFSSIASKKLRDEMKTKINDLRDVFNADVHQPGSFPSKAKMDAKRDDLIASVNFLNYIYSNPRL